MDAACTIQDSIHVFSLVRKYVSRILGTYHSLWGLFWTIQWEELFYFRWLRDLPALFMQSVIEKSE
mgnify:CR=1 FL=1